MLHVHHADRADHLVAALGDVLAQPTADPLTTEVIAVHSRGIELWVAQRLSERLGTSTDRRDGVASNLAFPFPGKLVGEVLAAATGLAEPQADPWQRDHLPWALLQVVETALASGDRGLLGPLATHLRTADGEVSPRRLSAVHRVAGLFDRYGVHRPAMLRDWVADRDVDGHGAPLPDALRWQPALWRALRQHLDPVDSPAERLEAATTALRKGTVPLDLPERLSLFGLTALPTTYVEVLSALAHQRDVHLFLLHPSAGLWDRVTRTLEGHIGWPLPRTQDPTATLARHPLLRAWGRDAREMQVVLTATAQPTVSPPPQRDAPASLLGYLQAHVRQDLDPAQAGTPPTLRNDDHSLQIHRCHGRLRQVEVLRDTLLHVLADDPTLEPRDLVVMCPDIESFAPLIEAVFDAEVVHDADHGPGDGNTSDPDALPDLRVRLADRSLRRTNPVLRVVADVLDIADSRVTASQVLDLAAQPAVMRRFGFDEDDLGTIQQWTDAAGVRWGLHEDHRLQQDVPTAQNTWRAGLDRLLAGVAVADEGLRTVAGVVPFDDVEGTDVDLAGRFAELLARIDHLVGRLTQPRTLPDWAGVLTEAADLLTWPRPRDGWQRLQLTRILDEVQRAASGRHDTTLTLPEVRALLGDELQGGPTRASHRSGDLTVCTLVPMRSVPHRVVFLLGLDDEVFPRRTAPDGDDLIERAACVGDRDLRTEDRQLLLDALMAASDRLVVLYSGHDERTNEVRPPAVPLGELLDAVDRTVVTEDGRPASDAITVTHPLQVFDPRNFRRGELLADRPFGFDPAQLEAAQSFAGGQQDPPAFLDRPLDPVGDDVIELHDLLRAVEQPVAAFLHQRLRVRFPRDGDRRSDGLPVELSHLDVWSVGDRLLQARLGGSDVARWREVERARGTLPPESLADGVTEQVEQDVEGLLRALESYGVPLTPGQAVLAEFTMDDGRRVVGSVEEVVDDTIRDIRYSRLGAPARLRAWVRLLLLSAAQPEVAWRAVTVGRAPSGSRRIARVSLLGPLAETPAQREEEARRWLEQLVALRDRALCEPLPLFCKTGAAYAEAVREIRVRQRYANPVGKARNAFEGLFGEAKTDAAAQVVYGAEVSFDQIYAEPAGPYEQGDGWDLDETSRFARLALRVWMPLLEQESERQI